jgi:hypothetical protein
VQQLALKADEIKAFRPVLTAALADIKLSKLVLLRRFLAFPARWGAT